MTAASSAEFSRRQRVRLVDDLPGVPAGTTGMVLMVTGFSWKRYHVEFDNGRTLGQIGAAHLEAA